MERRNHRWIITKSHCMYVFMANGISWEYCAINCINTIPYIVRYTCLHTHRHETLVPETAWSTLCPRWDFFPWGSWSQAVLVWRPEPSGPVYWINPPPTLPLSLPSGVSSAPPFQHTSNNQWITTQASLEISWCDNPNTYA